MRMTALVGATRDGGYIAWIRGAANPLYATSERAIELAMRNRLLQHGQHPLETRDRFHHFEQGFHPWKASDDGE